MCSIDQYIELSANKDSQIAYCKCCKTFSLSYKSACASFTLIELDQFRKVLEGLEQTDFHYQMHEEHKAIVKNPYACIGFCLAEEEVALLIGQVKEALTLYEAFQIIYE